MVEIDRRTLIQGAVWSAPVVAVAAATPMAAASESGPSVRFSVTEDPNTGFPVVVIVVTVYSSDDVVAPGVAVVSQQAAPGSEPPEWLTSTTTDPPEITDGNGQVTFLWTRSAYVGLAYRAIATLGPSRVVIERFPTLAPE
ncbi:hypothetical protein [Herbiconiux sp. A18JL235]|uniref:Uncharacterized protein n=1 Tax=Herbiconiux sp. A18JL235 TaxID=3152363 RepID=A0AB39BEI2_9MICO